MRFPKHEHGKAVKLRGSPYTAGQKVRKTTQRHVKHEARGQVSCKLCGERYKVGAYYEHTRDSLRHIRAVRR